MRLDKSAAKPPQAGYFDIHAIRNALARLMVKVEDIHEAAGSERSDLRQALESVMADIEGFSELLDQPSDACNRSNNDTAGL